VSSVEQFESPWLDVTAKLAEVMLKAAPGVAGAAVGQVDPLMAQVVTNALGAILQGQSEQLKQLERVGADTKALLQGPYQSGLTWLNEAANSQTAEERREYIEKSRDKFVEAEGQEHDLFRKALAQYQLGNSFFLLGREERARVWYQKAHSSATHHLLAEGTPVRAEWENYLSYSFSAQAGRLNLPSRNKRVLEKFGHKTPYVVIAGALGWGAAGVATGTGGIIAVPVIALAGGSVIVARHRAKEKFRKEAAPALALIEALGQLQRDTRALALKFDEPSPTWNTLEERLTRILLK
jgi:hypothetical protein